jgi:hypothetical protein
MRPNFAKISDLRLPLKPELLTQVASRNTKWNAARNPNPWRRVLWPRANLGNFRERQSDYSLEPELRRNCWNYAGPPISAPNTSTYWTPHSNLGQRDYRFAKTDWLGMCPPLWRPLSWKIVVCSWPLFYVPIKIKSRRRLAYAMKRLDRLWMSL